MYEVSRKLQALFDAPQRRRWLRLLPLSVASAVLEALAAVLVFVWLAVLVGDVAPAQSRSYLTWLGGWGAVPLGWLVLGLFVAKNGLRVIEVVLREMTARRATTDLSRKVLAAYLAAPWPWLARRRSTDLIRNVQDAVGQTCEGVLHLLRAASEFLVLVAVAGALLLAVPAMALLSLFTVGLLAAALLWALHGVYGRLGARLHQRSGEALSILGEAFGGARELRVFGGESLAADRYAHARSEVAGVSAWRGVLDAAPYLLLETLVVAGVAVLAAFSLGVKGNLLMLLGSFAYAVMRVLPASHRLVYHANAVRFAGASVDALTTDLADLEALARPVASPSPLPRELRRSVRFERVTYSWAEESEPAVAGVDLEIQRGEWLAVVGASGAGKSTLVDLLLGLVVPDSGRVLVDGRDLRGHEHAWHREIGFVPQQVFLSGESLRRNVAMGVTDEASDDGAVHRALELAGLGPLVAKLGAGLETPLLEGGSRFSGGERQRIAIARALYRRPALLILDEATSALDGDAESALARTLEGLRGGCTIVTVAHRLSLVQAADRVLWLERGRVRALGAPDSLLRREPGLRSIVGRSFRPGLPHDAIGGAPVTPAGRRSEPPRTHERSG